MYCKRERKSGPDPQDYITDYWTLEAMVTVHKNKQLHFPSCLFEYWSRLFKTSSQTLPGFPSLPSITPSVSKYFQTLGDSQSCLPNTCSFSKEIWNTDLVSLDHKPVSSECNPNGLKPDMELPLHSVLFCHHAIRLRQQTHGFKTRSSVTDRWQKWAVVMKLKAPKLTTLIELSFARYLNDKQIRSQPSTAEPRLWIQT